jgi:hypothetical protein
VRIFYKEDKSQNGKMVLNSYHLPPFVQSPFSTDVFPFDEWSAMHPVNQSTAYPNSQSKLKQNQPPMIQPQGTSINHASFGFPTAQLNYLGHYMQQMPLKTFNRPTEYRGTVYQLQGLDPNYFIHESRPHIGFDPEYLLKLNREMRWRPQPDIMYPAGFFR